MVDCLGNRFKVQLTGTSLPQKAPIVKYIGHFYTLFGLRDYNGCVKEKNELLYHRFSGLKILTHQLKNPLLYILLATTIISYILGERTNSLIILFMMLMSIGLGFGNEYAAEKAISDLLKKISLTAVVVRKGKREEIPVRDILVGDLVLLSIGSIVPADLQLTESIGIETNEAVLTGESLPVQKRVSDSAYMGTVIISGHGVGLVKAIGLHTKFGQISADLSSTRPETKFQKGVNQFSSLLVKVIISMCALIFVVNFLLGHPPIDSLLFALAIAISITPELFPVIVTVSLAQGSKKLAKKNLITKQLVAIEDLGNMDILCTDKTGTLTEGKISLTQFFDQDNHPHFHILELGLLCNGSGEHDKLSLNNIDTAIWDYAKNKGFKFSKNYNKIVTSPFDFDLQAMFAVVKKSKSLYYLLKGSPEKVVSLCRLEKSEKDKILTQFKLLSSQGIRVIAVAEKRIASQKEYSFADAHGLKFVGFLSFSDVPKAEITHHLNLLEKLDVSIKVLTGDNEMVTQHICEKVGLPIHNFLLGPDIEKMTDEELREKVLLNDFFARITPDQKVRIIMAFQSSGHTVGFLGDGINDAPALHTADVGISVNTAVDVAKDSASIVLLDKDLSVITSGIMEGRKIFSNIIKYILMGSSSDFGNSISAATASIFLPFLPMTASQILLTDLLYNVSQLSIPSDNSDPEDLERPERWNIGMIKRYMYLFGPASAIFDFATFAVMIYVFHAHEALFQTGWFVESLITEILVIFIIRTRRIPFFKSRPSWILTASCLSVVLFGLFIVFSPLASLFDFMPLPPLYFIILVLFVIVYLIVVESIKRFAKVTLTPQVIIKQ
jgi:P-type Mg2+ transporter